jgi:hypothetical protein
MTAFLNAPDAGVFEALRDESVFRSVRHCRRLIEQEPATIAAYTNAMSLFACAT